MFAKILAGSEGDEEEGGGEGFSGERGRRGKRFLSESVA